MFQNFSAIYVVYAAAALTGIMIAEGCYLLYAGRLSLIHISEPTRQY